MFRMFFDALMFFVTVREVATVARSRRPERVKRYLVA